MDLGIAGTANVIEDYRTSFLVGISEGTISGNSLTGTLELTGTLVVGTIHSDSSGSTYQETVTLTRQ